MATLFSPILYWVPEGPYPANTLEFLSQSFLDATAFSVWCTLYLLAPVALVWAAASGAGQERTWRASDLDKYKSEAMTFLAALLPLVIVAFAMRGVGRSANPHYRTFQATYNAAMANLSRENKLRLSAFDFSFISWPLEFNAAKESKSSNLYITYPNKLVVDLLMALFIIFWLIVSFGVSDDDTDSFFYWATYPLARMSMAFIVLVYYLIYQWGIKFIYYGSFNGGQHQMGHFYSHQRCDLIFGRGGERFRLLTRDSNSVDAMFFDRRGRSVNGDVLVICCEGNCGFYECGMNHTPLSLGYSVLVWNHPGFCCSSGEPYPSQEANAIDCVMLFALRFLGFPESNVAIYGWSIGGFTATWIGMNYPRINGLLLDATFDTLEGIVSYHQPFPCFGVFMPFLNSIGYMNISKQLRFYSGPVRLIRRTKDDIMSYRRMLKTNRTNFILQDLLVHRYPLLLGNYRAYNVFFRFIETKGEAREALFRQYGANLSDLSQYPVSAAYPNRLGVGMGDADCDRLVLLLAAAYMVDLHSSHCTPMPENLFSWGGPLP